MRRMVWSWKGNQPRNVFHQVWNATPFPKGKTREAAPGPSIPHSALTRQDAQAEWAAAVEEGFLEAAKQASLEISTEGAPKVECLVEIYRPMRPCCLSSTHRARNVLRCRLPLLYQARF